MSISPNPVVTMVARSPQRTMRLPIGIGPTTPMNPLIMVGAAAAETLDPSRRAMGGVTGMVAVIPAALSNVGR